MKTTLTLTRMLGRSLVAAALVLTVGNSTLFATDEGFKNENYLYTGVDWPKLDYNITISFYEGNINAYYIQPEATLHEMPANRVIQMTQTSNSAATAQNGFYIRGSMDVIAGTIKLVNVHGRSHGVSIDDGGYVGEISGSIIVDHNGAYSYEDSQESDFTAGLYIDGNSLKGNDGFTPGDTDTSSTLDIFSGSVLVTSTEASVRGIELEGSIEKVNDQYEFTGGNTLNMMTETASVTVQSQTGGVQAIRNEYGTINKVDGTIIATTGGSGTAIGYYNTGTTGEVAGSFAVEQSGDKTATAVWNAHMGNDPGTIALITGNLQATSNTGDARAIYNIGDITAIKADITATSTAGVVRALHCDKDNDGTATGSIGSVAGSITANAYGLSQAVYNEGKIGDVNATITATSATGNAYGFYLASGSSIGIISGSITAIAESTGGAFGIRTVSQEAIDFGDRTLISATSVSGSAFAIYADGTNLELSSSGSVSMVGSIRVKDAVQGLVGGALSIESGSFELSSPLDHQSSINAGSITIKENATLSLVLSGDNVLSSSMLGFDNQGTLKLSAASNAVAGTSIAISADTTMNFEETGKVVSYGGTVSGNNFIVSQMQSLHLDTESSGITTLDDNARVVVTNPEQTVSITMNFNAEAGVNVNSVTTVTDATNIATAELDQSFAQFVEETKLPSLTLSDAEAYHFGVAGLSAGESVELVFDVGAGYDVSMFTVYHLADGATSWSDATIIKDFNYNGQQLSFVANGFSSYAYSIMVPEPSTATLSLLALAGLMMRRRRH
ncbi:MAG: PEP-CTERM sorting domain-containing protein [Akkermansia sp.]